VNGWVLGWTIGLAVVAVVVILLVLLIVLASRAGAKAEAILVALQDARDNTEGMWQLDATNQVTDRIIASATAAREHLAEIGAGTAVHQ